MLVSLDDVKASLGIASNNTSKDDFLTGQINLISEVVESYCRRKFELATYVQTFYEDDYRPSPTLQTFHYPVIPDSVSATLDGEVLDGFRVHYPTGTLTRRDGFFYGELTEITYDAGYETIPLAIQEVVKSLVTERYNKSQAGVNLSFGSDVQRVSIPGAISIDFDYTLTNNDRSTGFGVILGNYVNVLDAYRSERAIIGDSKLSYVVAVE